MAAAPARSGGAIQLSLLQMAERLRDTIQRSKLTVPNPWTYTSKARDWSQKAQALLEEIARRGETAEFRRRLDALSAEVEADRDFREARRRF